MRIIDLPHKDAYVRAIARGHDLTRQGQRVHTGQWPDREFRDHADFQRWVWDALERRINARGGLPEYRGRKDTTDEFYRFWRDSRAVREIHTRRLRVYGFETPDARRRFSHLLASRND